MERRTYFLGCIALVLLLFASNGDALRQTGVCWRFHNRSSCLRNNFQCSNGYCIDYGLYCNGRNDCGDNSDEAYCNTRYDCPKSMRKCPSTSDYGKCIPEEWFCNGIRNCYDGRDGEESCDGIKYKEQSSKVKALKWMTEQKKSQSTPEMWGFLVDKSAVSLYLASPMWPNKDNETRKEMAYEVSIQLLSRLSQRKLRDVPSSDLASYINALLVTCVDPRKFHGLDIVQELRTRVDNQNYTNPYLLLSLCNAGDFITELDKMKLIKAFWSKYRAFWTDIQAVAVMALACANKQPGNEVDSETMHELTLELKQRQYRNGTIENLRTTALVMQALFAAEPDADPENFDENKALQQIMTMQKPDGSFGSYMNTYYALPVLNCMSLVNISSSHCESSLKEESSALEELTNRSGPKIHVRYSLWIGNEKDFERHLALRVPANISFYGVMEMAADIDSRYRFEYVVINRKPYVDGLSGLQHDPEKGKLWFLYTIVEGKPTPSQESPADVRPKDNEHFLMWYRTGSWIS